MCCTMLLTQSSKQQSLLQKGLNLSLFGLLLKVCWHGLGRRALANDKSHLVIGVHPL